jgi:uncharacterized membrane protein (TIGR02234 family)
VTSRPRPLADDVLRVSGRTLDAANTALALVALVGVVAVLATRGLARRAVGAVLAVAGGGLVWRSITGLSEISEARARTVVAAKHSSVVLDPHVAHRVTTHAVWPLLSAGCGLLVLVAGVAIALRGHRWTGMSAKYDAPVSGVERDDDEQVRQARADASMWASLDRGDDPTDASTSGGS